MGALAAKETRRETILRCAAELFDDTGYHQCSMSDLARAVGVSKPTLYHYFTGKEEILYWLHDEFINLLLTRHGRRQDLGMAPRLMLLETISDIVELMETHRGHVRVFFEHHRELPPEQHAHIQQKRDEYFALVRDIIAAGMDNGEFQTTTSPELAAFAIFGMANWSYQWYSSDGPLRPREIAYQFWSFALFGLEATSDDTGP